MLVRWYLTGYDRLPKIGTRARVPRIARYLPTLPRSDGALWEEVETPGGGCIVKVLAPAEIHEQLRADAGFLEIPDDLTVSSRILQRILRLGYTEETYGSRLRVIELLTGGRRLGIIG